MSVIKIVKSSLKLVKDNPLSLKIREKEFDKHFLHGDNVNLFKGVYKSFNEAQNHLPKNRPGDYDNKESADLYDDRQKIVHASDYPALFWLNKILKDSRTLFDFGGHVGILYYCYKDLLDFPEEFKWTVSDLPEVMKRGEELAKQRGEERLDFSLGIETCSGYDILFSSGALQYLSWSLSDQLKEVDQLPKHILLNRMPVHKKETIFTVQSMGTAFCPYKVQNENELVSGLESLGYNLVKTWRNEEKSCSIAFSPEYSVDHYRGFYFQLVSPV